MAEALRMLLRRLRGVDEEDYEDVVNSALDDTAHREKKVVYVGNLDNEVTPQQLRTAFIPFGPISSIQIR